MPDHPATILHYRYIPAQNQQACTTLVFIHGIAGSQASWLPAFDQLAACAHLLFVDCLGFGQSPRPQAAYTVSKHLEALDATLTHWQNSNGLQHQTVFLIGHSMGALLCAHWALGMPTQNRQTSAPGNSRHLAGVVLASLPLFENEQDALASIGSTSLFNRWMALETPLARATCWLMCHLRPWLTPLMPHLMPDLPPDVARDSLQHSWTSYSQTLRQVIIQSRGQDLLQALANTGIPLQIIHGRNDTVANASRMRRLLDDLSRKHAIEHPIEQAMKHPIDTLTIDGAHDIVFTHPQDMTGAIRRFVARTSGC